ncbi:Hsp20/alpha crystallin family protein [Emticicia sp. BO119]|uniref:Hsp20/alpha crystallin family protein n=1 Tax=Emticicia sp. BO119 TaxID=2757768 RepID=UPI0015F0D069|nr:Hsp20/alpha crystallin family protein [Emticicia sp. BO119]MBA4852979.1 Hsp20/alpha crystallin family protein [Emticicia sp. BO119]
MSLIKWKKDDLFPTFDSLWDDFFNKDFYNRGVNLGTRIPAVNVSETDTSYHVEVAIPGFKKEDFNIDIENNVLTISSEQKNEKEEFEGKKATRKEFSYSSFQRSFQIPESVKEDAIAASYKDGILKLDLPKTEPAKAKDKKKIAIQ